MNKYIKVKPALLFSSIIAIILLIYAFTLDLNTAGEDSGSSAASTERETELSSGDQESVNEEELSTLFRQDSEEEERSKLLTQEDSDFYAASRGDLDRYAQETASPSAGEAASSSSSGSGSGSGKEADAAQETPASASKSEPAATAPAATAQNTSASTPAEPADTSAGQAAAGTAASDDLDLLARLIMAEAQGEPYEAQAAVGAVVMNRVKSGDWPDSIKEVIYQKIGEYYQFTPVVNGWIDKPADEEAVKAAKAAMNGEDPSGGAQFYYDDKCTNEWILAKTVSVQIGHMIFAF
jgi:spore germination cell wall hydrolase CwlJ-like protein